MHSVRPALWRAVLCTTAGILASACAPLGDINRRSWLAVHSTLRAMANISGSKRSPGSQFNPQWEYDYLFTAVANGVQCLVCGKVNSTVRKYHLERHYKAYHSSEYDNVVGDDREALLNWLREEKTVVNIIEPVIVQDINDEVENTTDADNDFDTEREEVHKRKPEEYLEFSLPKRSCMQTKDQEDPAEKKRRDDCRIFGEHVANKLNMYDSRIQAIVQHQINNILFEADMGRYSHSLPEQWSASPASSPALQEEEAVLASSPAPHGCQETSSDLQLALPHSSSSQPYLEVVKGLEGVAEQHMPHSERLEEEKIPELGSPHRSTSHHLDTNAELHGTDNSICNKLYNKAVESHLQTIRDTEGKLTGNIPSLQKEDEFEVFGQSVAIQLRTLPFAIALETQLKLQSILTEMKLKINYCESESFRNGIPALVAPT